METEFADQMQTLAIAYQIAARRQFLTLQRSWSSYIKSVLAGLPFIFILHIWFTLQPKTEYQYLNLVIFIVWTFGSYPIIMLLKEDKWWAKYSFRIGGVLIPCLITSHLEPFLMTETADCNYRKTYAVIYCLWHFYYFHRTFIDTFPFRVAVLVKIGAFVGLWFFFSCIVLNEKPPIGVWISLECIILLALFLESVEDGVSLSTLIEIIGDVRGVIQGQWILFLLVYSMGKLLVRCIGLNVATIGTFQYSFILLHAVRICVAVVFKVFIGGVAMCLTELRYSIPQMLTFSLGNNRSIQGIILSVMVFHTSTGAELSTYVHNLILCFVVVMFLETWRQLKTACLYIGNYKWKSHIKAVCVSVSIAVLPVIIVHQCSLTEGINFWILMVVSECFTMVLKVFTSLVTYAIYMYSESENNDNLLYLIRVTSTVCIILLSFLRVYFDINYSILGPWNWVRFVLMAWGEIVGSYLILLQEWREFEQRKQFMRRLDIIPDATEAQILYFNDVCPICHNDLHPGAKITQCGHIFHLNCLNVWTLQNKKCPLCMQEIFTPLTTTGNVTGAGHDDDDEEEDYDFGNDEDDDNDDDDDDDDHDHEDGRGGGGSDGFHDSFDDETE